MCVIIKKVVFNQEVYIMKRSKKEQKTKTTEAKPTTRQASKQAKDAPNTIKKKKSPTASQAVVPGPRQQ